MIKRIGKITISGSLLIAALVCGTAGEATAQFLITRYTIDGGGGTTATGGPFTLGGTIGQPDAGRLAGAGFRLAGGFWLGGADVSGVADGTPGAGPPTEPPLAFRAYPPSHNPVSSRTVVAFDLPQSSPVRLTLHDVSGRLVRVLTEAQLPAGRHERAWDRRDAFGHPVASGLYFLRLEAGSHGSRQKLVVLP